MGATVTVLGGSGYAGGELLRSIASHPALTVIGASADRRIGDPFAAVHPHLAGLEGSFGAVAEVAGMGADICFSCLPDGAPPEAEEGIVIDLSGAHRHENGWVYALTEYARAEVAVADLISNPGCYPTASLLGLLPFARAGVIAEPIVIDAMSGTSGAGRKDDDELSLAHLGADIHAYGTTEHKHVGEIESGLSSLGQMDVSVSFTPHLVPMPRGLLVTARALTTGSLTDSAALDILQSAYEKENFVTVIDEWPRTKAVAATNRTIVSARVDTRTGWLIVSSAIDNLGKGAAGQAIQNANVRLGLEESTGLGAFGAWP
jgi:N-acetyl-gamma-glutamyl-phosphate reductase